jgi:hypothetical protein
MIEFMPRVCADFYDTNRNLLFRITRDDLGKYVKAPEAIEQDPLYRMLLDDGSIKLAPVNTRDKRDLENDPYAGATAEGKEIKPKTAKTKAEPKPKPETKQESKQDPDPSDNAVGIETK